MANTLILKEKNMIKRGGLFVFAAALVFLASSAFAAGKETAYERVIRTETIRCGYGTSPPYLDKNPNTGELTGMVPDIWKEIGLDLGIKIEWAEEVGWGNFIEGLNTGRYDVFCSLIWPDAGRSKFLTLSDSAVFSFLHAYVRTDDKRFDQDLEKINDPAVKIPAVEGDVSVAMAQRRFPKATIVYLPQTNTASDMLMSVATGKADVLFLNGIMFEAYNEKNPGVLRKLENLPPSFTFPSYFSVRNGEFALRDMINVALIGMTNDGRLQKIVERYSQEDRAPLKNFEQ